MIGDPELVAIANRIRSELALPLKAKLVIGARVLLALAAIIFGVKMWLDGYSGAAMAIGTGILIAELTGLGLSQSQANDVVGRVINLISTKLGPPPSGGAPPSNAS